MNYSTTVGRNMRGEIEAETRIPMDQQGRELRVITGKASPGVSTYVQVGIVTGGVKGGFVGFQCALGIGGRGDFYKRLRHAKEARATLKTIEALHAEALADIGPVLEAARAQYAAEGTAQAVAA